MSVVSTRYRNYQILAFGLTFLSYAIYHAGRQPYATTKSALSPVNGTSASDPGYYPFNTGDGHTYLGNLDTCYLSAYAVGLFIAGPLGDRLNLRLFLSFGMIGSGVFLGLIGLFYYMNVHSVYLFALSDIIAGLFQATGWPGCVVVMTRWFDKTYMGTIMGVWNAHSSVGNIFGKYTGAALQEAFGWQWAYLGMGLIMIAVGGILLVTLRPQPTDVFTVDELTQIRAQHKAEYERKQELEKQKKKLKRARSKAAAGREEEAKLNVEPDSDEQYGALTTAGSVPAADDLSPPSPAVLSLSPTAVVPTTPVVSHQPLPFHRALLIPGVLEFSFALFFSKLVTYALIFWLPFYLSTLGYDATVSSNMSTAFDYGGILGGVIAGWWSDRNGKRGLVSFIMAALCIPSLFIYTWLGGYGLWLNVLLLFIVGVLVNGPYTLISSAVCSDLGSHPSLMGNPLAMSTVTGIIDGFGSVGAALEGKIVDGISQQWSWAGAFYALMIFSALCCLTIIRVVKHEVFGLPKKLGMPPVTATPDGTSIENEIVPLEHEGDDDQTALVSSNSSNGSGMYAGPIRKSRSINK